jgi:hypothetical protein
LYFQKGQFFVFFTELAFSILASIGCIVIASKKLQNSNSSFGFVGNVSHLGGDDYRIFSLKKRGNFGVNPLTLLSNYTFSA